MSEYDKLDINTTSSFILTYIRDANSSQSVIDLFEYLYAPLGKEVFKSLFPLILTYGKSVFSNPLAIEFGSAGEQRTKVFYYDPRSTYKRRCRE